ncbi:histidinol-phosphate transaminase [Paenibacillus rigui]|uniref:Histidinol-phosphate aminotransferase n=1 Tax=Paenibacillus rigui TaxID=554312 RepID=A0A229UPL3_9BACL|nr:histidinol-phosphate transaminase [Paenibacillus rigui]OXM85304.1 histidinol-phosphate transaminase [Paenibacillus rigui]
MIDEIQVQGRKILQQMKPYSPGKPIWEVQQELGIDYVVKLASNENPLGPSPKALEALAAFLPELNRYPDAGAKLLNQALAAQLNLQPQQLIVTNGGDELITLVAETFLEAGDEIVVPSPTFSEYEFGATLMGASTVSVPLNDDYSYDISAILSSVTERTKLVCICSPNNPTGTYLGKEDLKRLLDALPKRVLVLFDAAYTHFASAEDYTDGLEFVRAGYPIIVLQTFSKIYGLAGIRVGFGAASVELVSQIYKVKEPFNVNALAQVGAAAAIADKEHVDKSRKLNAAGREQLYGAFRRFGLRYTESMANFILVELGPDAQTIYERLMQEGVIVRYGVGWGLPGHVRISVGTQEENAFLIEKLGGILAKDGQ